MIPALLLMLGIGAACGIVLGLSSKIFYVYVARTRGRND